MFEADGAGSLTHVEQLEETANCYRYAHTTLYKETIIFATRPAAGLHNAVAKARLLHELRPNNWNDRGFDDDCIQLIRGIKNTEFPPSMQLT